MRVSIRTLLQAAAVVTVVCSLVTLVPSDHFALQLFVHFRLQYFVASGLLLIVFAALWEPRYALVMLLAGALNASFVLPWYLDVQPTRDGTPLKLLLANVLASNGEHERLLDLIEAEQPDIIVLLEVSPHWEEPLRVLDETYPFNIVEPRNHQFGIALFSKRPLTSAASVDSEPFGHATLLATLDIDGRSVQFVATHPMIPLGTRNYDARNEQLDGVASLLQKAGGPRILIADLNATMWDSHYRALENRTWLRNVRRGFGLVPTWPTFLPLVMIPIDHVLVSEDIGVAEVRAGARIGSDHLPLVVSLSL